MNNWNFVINWLDNNVPFQLVSSTVEDDKKPASLSYRVNQDCQKICNYCRSGDVFDKYFYHVFQRQI